MDSATYPAAALSTNPGLFSSMEPPARLGVFGDPVAHSISPAMHNAALQKDGLAMQYVRLHATVEEFPAAARALAGAGFLGANVTIPHKTAALEICDDLDEHARITGAVNTLVVDGGRLCGFSTDGPGLVRAVHEEFFVDLRDLRVMVLGAGGGAGRSIAVQCALEKCERLVLVNRTAEKAAALARELASRFRSDRLVGPAERCIAVPWEEKAIAAALDGCDLLINATSIGLRRTDPSPISPSLLTPNLLVFDTIYSAGRTKLVENAAAAGARACDGLSMLLHQGALSYEIWTNRPAPVEEMRGALMAARG